MKAKLNLVPRRRTPNQLEMLRDELAFVRKHLEDLERRLMAAIAGPATAA